MTIVLYSYHGSDITLLDWLLTCSFLVDSGWDVFKPDVIGLVDRLILNLSPIDRCIITPMALCVIP